MAFRHLYEMLNQVEHGVKGEFGNKSMMMIVVIESVILSLTILARSPLAKRRNSRIFEA